MKRRVVVVYEVDVADGSGDYLTTKFALEAGTIISTEAADMLQDWCSCDKPVWSNEPHTWVEGTDDGSGYGTLAGWRHNDCMWMVRS